MAFSANRRPVSPEKARLRLEQLCAKAEHSTGELRRKLVQWGIDPQQAEEIIDNLRQRRFVDDARFARAYVLDKYRFGSWGRRKIMLGLYQKSVDAQVALKALDVIDNTEYIRRLAAVLRSKAGQLHETDSFESRQKLLRYAVGRGFEIDLAKRVIDKLFPS